MFIISGPIFFWMELSVIDNGGNFLCSLLPSERKWDKEVGETMGDVRLMGGIATEGGTLRLCEIEIRKPSTMWVKH